MKQKPTYGEMLEGTLFKNTFCDLYWLVLKPMENNRVKIIFLEKTDFLLYFDKQMSHQITTIVKL